jgi:hypothetical protein
MDKLPPLAASRNRRVESVHVTSFAQAVTPTLSEIRMELVRDLQHHLTRFTSTRSAEEKGACLQLLEDLELLVRHDPAELGFE